MKFPENFFIYNNWLSVSVAGLSNPHFQNIVFLAGFSKFPTLALTSEIHVWSPMKPLGHRPIASMVVEDMVGVSFTAQTLSNILTVEGFLRR